MAEWEEWHSCSCSCSCSSSSSSSYAIGGCDVGDQRVDEFPCLCELWIENCPKLKAIMHKNNSSNNINNGNDHLECLRIEEYGSLRSFPSGKLPTTLKTLQIRNCGQLESIPESSSSQLLTNIYGCLNLKCLPESLLLNSRTCTITNCPALESVLPNQMHNCLTSLRQLVIRDCPGLLSFPEGGLPPNFQQPMSEWGLHKLTSLDRLVIDGSVGCLDNMVSFPPLIPDDDDDDDVLPSSITWLSISNLQNVESLSKGLLKLTSLQYLNIYNCPKLQSLPTAEGSLLLLPPTIQTLLIENCPLLKERCMRDAGGDYWPLIAHIRNVDLRDSSN